jgi:glutamate decarboxylase
MYEVTPEGAQDAELIPTYAARSFDHPVPKYRMPDASMPAPDAYRLVSDELSLDGNPVLNLATFVTNWMDDYANRLLTETAAKNLIDQDEYPQTQEIHQRVVAMIGNLLNAPGRRATGTGTVGSSEAIMLGLLAHRRRWKARREAAGRPTDAPNVVVGADAHTCWEKFFRYFEVEGRVVPMQPGVYTLTPEAVRDRLDENTIAVGGILGTTFTGQADDIAGIDAVVSEVNEREGWDIPIHVDAASGGFLLPFTDPDYLWDFRLENVRSINVSNHKFGLVYPGMGTVVFREKDDLPEELVFHINYLGGDMPNYSLNFSRSSSQVILQYYMLVRLGREGYGRVMHNVMANAHHLEDKVVATGHFDLLTDRNRFPIVVAKPKDAAAVDVFALSRRLRERGWIAPAYTLPPDADDITVLRMVVKENFSRDMVDLFVGDMTEAIEEPELPPVKHDPAHQPVS